jgi:hypothetical protein
VKLKPKIILFIFLGLVLILAFLRLLSSEDCWIKDKNGNWIKHGNPSGPPPTQEAVSPKFRLSVSETIDISLAVATFLLAIAAFWNIIEGRKQFRISKSPIFDIALEGDFEQSYNDEGENRFYNQTVPLKIRNVGYGPAFNMYVSLKQGNLAYEYDPIKSKLIQQGFSMAINDSITMKFNMNNATDEQLKNSVEIKIECKNSFGKRIIYEFLGPINQQGGYTVFSLKNIDFTKA